MTGSNITSREEACSYLGVTVYDSIDTIKKAYRERVKIFHPDVNPGLNEQYLRVQKAYEYLMNSTSQGNYYFYTNSMQMTPEPRQAKIFQSNAHAKSQFMRQKQAEAERLKVKRRENERKQEQQKLRFSSEMEFACAQKKSQEQEILEKIRTIWIVENIKRQIEVERNKAEEENRRKLYQAFLQQQINEKTDEKP